MEWFLSILHVEPQLLKEFIESSNSELNTIENILKSDVKEQDFQDVLECVYRSIHMIKGNASLLDLKFYAKKAHNFEEEIEELQRKEDLATKDFIPLVLRLGEMRSDIGEINNMIARISQIHTHFRPKRSFESQILVRSIDNLIQTTSKDLKKEVHFIHQNFQGDQIPYQYRLLVKEILIQMVRNSLGHGIETPPERKKCNKAKYGIIEIESYFKQDSFFISYQDDGRGLQIDELREKAKSMKKWEKYDIDKWDDSKIASTIFEPGITTAKTTDLIAGRGMGMDIILKKITEHGGSVNIDYKQGKYIKFVVDLPVKNPVQSRLK
jgi:chemotaxis protein histidine kinase CheA